jgi:hypothetical protein
MSYSASSKTQSVIFEKRQTQTSPIKYPIIDSDGKKIKTNRRLNASDYLDRIEIEELEIQETEFKQLFNL